MDGNEKSIGKQLLSMDRTIKPVGFPEKTMAILMK
jgi:hypothetical protein